MKNWMVILSTLIYVIMIHSCKPSGEKTQEQGNQQDAGEKISLSEEQIQANKLVVGHATEHKFRRTISAVGNLEVLPGNRRIVNAKMGGIVHDLKLLPGSPVIAGEVLFRLENPEFIRLQEDYLAGKGLLEWRKEEYERQKILATDNVTAKKEFLAAQSEYWSIQAKMEALLIRFSFLNIDADKLSAGTMLRSLPVTAPISGFVTKVNVHNGQFLSESDEVAEIVQTSPILLKLKVFEKDIVHIKEGQTVLYTLPDVSLENFKARIEKAGKSLEEDRTVTVFARSAGENLTSVIPGMFVKALIVTEEFTTLALPLTALGGSDENQFVLIRTNNEGDYWNIERKKVLTGYRDESMVEILPESGLSVDDQVVVSGTFSIVGR
jgi:cobalt-zinc-cadmium efflux system membrane fusion protein